MTASPSAASARSATTACTPRSARPGSRSSSTSCCTSTSRPAAASDDVADTVHYGELAQQVVAAVEGEPVDLIETLAQRLADLALAYPRVDEVEVTVHKPEAPVGRPVRGRRRRPSCGAGRDRAAGTPGGAVARQQPGRPPRAAAGRGRRARRHPRPAGARRLAGVRDRPGRRPGPARLPQRRRRRRGSALAAHAARARAGGRERVRPGARRAVGAADPRRRPRRGRRPGRRRARPAGAAPAGRASGRSCWCPGSTSTRPRSCPGRPGRRPGRAARRVRASAGGTTSTSWCRRDGGCSPGADEADPGRASLVALLLAAAAVRGASLQISRTAARCCRR